MKGPVRRAGQSARRNHPHLTTLAHNHFAQVVKDVIDQRVVEFAFDDLSGRLVEVARNQSIRLEQECFAATGHRRRRNLGEGLATQFVGAGLPECFAEGRKPRAILGFNDFPCTATQLLDGYRIEVNRYIESRLNPSTW